MPETSAPEHGLFRPEVTERHANRLWGEVILVQPVSTRVLASLLLAIALAVGVLGSCAQYVRTETVTGFISPDSGVSKIYASRAGTVSSVGVQVGDVVEAGSILLTVDSGVTLSDGGALLEAQADQLLSQKRDLEAKAEAASMLLEQEQQRAVKQIETLERQLEYLRSTAALARERRELAETRHRILKQLVDRGMLSNSELDGQRNVVLTLRAELLDLDRQILETTDRLASVRTELQTSPLRDREKQADIRLELAQVDAQITEAESLSSYGIRAPTSGRIAALQATPGARVRPEIPVAVILPEGAQLEANLFVPTRAVGFVELGQEVGIKYAAFPYQRFGIYTGRIAKLETTILGADEVEAPIRLDEPVYRAVVELDAEEITTAGRSYPVQAGMLLEAEIVLERRSVLEWLLGPLYGLRGTR